MRGEIKKSLLLQVTLVIVTVVLFPLQDVWGTIYYAKPDLGGGDCTRAAPCYFLTAVGLADNGDTIYFRQGTYKNDTSNRVLYINESVRLYGGWDGDPHSRILVRDPEIYPTILDGENARRVIYITGSISPIIDGFTIRNGDAKDWGAICEGINATGCGGGIYVYLANALINNNKILNNQANDGKGQGGGVHLERASGTIVRKNLFQSNQARLGGGLNLYGSTSTPPRIEDNNQFIQNSAGAGGAIGFNEQPNPTIQDNFFDNNSEQIWGGGIYGAGPATIARNLFQNHLGRSIIFLSGFQGNLEGNRLFNNNTMVGIYLIGGSPPYPIVSNNIFARSGTSYALAAGGETFSTNLNAVLEHNTIVGEGIGAGILASGFCNLSVNNNIIAGYPTGIEIDADPAMVFARHTLFDNSVTTHGNNVNFFNSLVGDPVFKNPAANDFHIKMTSAAKDAGTANFITTTQDIDGDPRPIGGAPDIGADEINPLLLYLPLLRK